jgi:hypothetical protein
MGYLLELVFTLQCSLKMQALHGSAGGTVPMFLSHPLLLVRRLPLTEPVLPWDEWKEEQSDGLQVYVLFNVHLYLSVT